MSAATLHKPRKAATLERRVARDRRRICALLAQARAAWHAGQIEQAGKHIEEAHGIADALKTWEGGHSQHGVQLATAVARHWSDLRASVPGLGHDMNDFRITINGLVHIRREHPSGVRYLVVRRDGVPSVLYPQVAKRVCSRIEAAFREKQRAATP